MKVRKQFVVAAWCVGLATVFVPAIGAGASTSAVRGPAASGVVHVTAPKPGTWRRVTATGLGNINEAGLVRGTDGVLHVLWNTGTAPGSYKILDTPIAANGIVGPTTTVASHFYLASYPDGTVTPTGLDAFFMGTKSSTPGSPSGTYEATRPLRSGAWHLSLAPAPAANPNWYDNLSATTGADGKPFVAFVTTGGMAVLHYGHSERLIPISGCCEYVPGIGTDGKTGQTWLTYYSNQTKTGTYFQPLNASGAPAKGASRAPGSFTGANSLGGTERVTAVGRGHGRPGVYITYLSGYPFARAVDLYRLGSRTAAAVVRLPAINNIGVSTLAADPQGRIWVAWGSLTSGQASLFVRRSNTTVTAFSSIARIPLPAGTDDLWRVYMSAQSGRLDVVALLTVHNAIAYWATQVLPPK